jgi:hypothetical protein
VVIQDLKFLFDPMLKKNHSKPFTHDYQKLVGGGALTSPPIAQDASSYKFEFRKLSTRFSMLLRMFLQPKTNHQWKKAWLWIFLSCLGIAWEIFVLVRSHMFNEILQPPLVSEMKLGLIVALPAIWV